MQSALRVSTRAWKARPDVRGANLAAFALRALLQHCHARRARLAMPQPSRALWSALCVLVAQVALSAQESPSYACLAPLLQVLQQRHATSAQLANLPRHQA